MRINVQGNRSSEDQWGSISYNESENKVDEQMIASSLKWVTEIKSTQRDSIHDQDKSPRNDPPNNEPKFPIYFMEKSNGFPPLGYGPNDNVSHGLPPYDQMNGSPLTGFPPSGYIVLTNSRSPGS